MKTYDHTFDVTVKSPRGRKIKTVRVEFDDSDCISEWRGLLYYKNPSEVAVEKAALFTNPLNCEARRAP